ncbi:MAG: N-formylglutamate amidohydrolase [Gemmatimonadaceae bacterium]
MIDAFHVSRPAKSSPLLYDSPHSGRYYPPDFASNATRVDLRRGEDAYVDDLLAGAPEHGATLLIAVYPRCYIDVNREETDIDESLLSEPWPTPLQPTDKTRRGLGLIRRLVVPGVEAQAVPLTVAQVRERIALAYTPYHEALSSLVEEVRAVHGVVRHVNWHSMKSLGNAMTPDGPGARRPDFVVSDVRGASAAPSFTAQIVDSLRGMGYTVALNDPYTGGTIVQRIGKPADGIHSVQVEINRALYLDETLVEKANGFRALAANLDRLTTVLADAA